MIQLPDTSGVAMTMGPATAKARLTRRQVQWFSNVIGSWLFHAVGLPYEDAAAVLSRKVSARHMRRIVDKMKPVRSLPDPHGFAAGWRFQIGEMGPDKGARPRPHPKTKRRPKLPRRAPASRGRSSTGPATTSGPG